MFIKLTTQRNMVQNMCNTYEHPYKVDENKFFPLKGLDNEHSR